MLFPFLYPTLSLAGGILLGSLTSPSLAAGVVPMIFCLLCAWIFFSAFKKTGVVFAFILLAFFFLGSSLFTHWNNTFEKNPLKRLSTDEYIDFHGRLYKSLSRGHERDYLFLRVEKIFVLNEEKKIQGNLRISVPHTQRAPTPLELHIRDEIRVSAKLSPSQGYRNFSPSALDLYLESQNIHNRAFTKSPMLIEKLKSGEKISLPRIISIIRRKLQQEIERHFSGPLHSILSSQGAVVEALLLGERGRMDPEISRGLQHAGIFHLFAISGAHIAIISFLLFSLFRFLRLPDRANYILLIFFLVFYALLVEGRPSVMRATVMALAFLTGKLIWRNVNLLNTLAISAFIILVFNPASLFSVGFQMTFAATLSIILFFPKVINFLPRLPLRISEIFALSLTAQLGVLPFVAHAFNRVTFSSLVLNFAAIPLVGLTMAFGYIFLLLSLMSPIAAGILAKFIHFFVNLLIAASHAFDLIPGLSFRIPTPPLIVVLGYFFFLGLLLVPVKIRRQKVISSVCFAIFLALLAIHPFPAHSKTLRLTFIDVGQGDSILIEFPGSKKMLLDGGGTPEDTFDIGERIVSPFLWQRGIRKIDYLVLTHAHPDHMNGVKAVARNFKIKEFWEAFSPEDNRSYTELKRRLLLSTSLRRMFRGHVESIDGVKVEILNPIQADPIVSKILNDQSLVLRISYGQTAFLLTGDIGKAVEKELAQFPHFLRSDVLKSPHHGSDSSSSEEFLAAVAPRFLILSVGAGNRYSLPDPDVINRYLDIGANIYRTDHVGAVEVSSDGQNLFFRTASGDR
jgi:competence protein ComEC